MRSGAAMQSLDGPPQPSVHQATRIETIVIGAGQAGLAMSHYLGQLGREHLVLERGGVAERWRSERWDSLVMCNPRWGLDLPGFTYDGPDPDGFPPRDEVVAWLEHYAALNGRHVRYGVNVSGVWPIDGSGEWLVDSSNGAFVSDNVIVATGPFQEARVPAFAHDLSPDLVQVPCNRYRNGDALPSGAVLVVGSGSSGCQIAEDLLAAGRRVFLSVGRHKRVPRFYRGHDIDWWYRELGEFEQVGAPPRFRVPAAFTSSGASIRDFPSMGITLLGRTEGAVDHRLRVARDLNTNLALADSYCRQIVRLMNFLARFHKLDVDEPQPDEEQRPHDELPEREEIDLVEEGINTIVWASGYDVDFSFVHASVFDDRATPRHHRGVTEQPGLMFLGLQWLHKYKSSFVFGVGEDAAHLAEHLELTRQRVSRG